MKIIEIEGEKFELPDWVNYVAMDIDGNWYGYETEPTISSQYERWLADEGRTIGINNNVPHWKETLRKI